jgi:hypothetical protein
VVTTGAVAAAVASHLAVTRSVADIHRRMDVMEVRMASLIEELAVTPPTTP